MGKSSGTSATQLQAQNMSEEMEETLISNMNQEMTMAKEAWDQWKVRDTAPDGSSITGTMNLQRLEGMKTIEEQKDFLTKGLPDVNPGIAPAVDAINASMGNEIAASDKQMAMMNPYGSAREDAVDRANEFRRGSEIAKTKGAMTADWALKKDQYDKNALYDWASAMQTGAPINSDNLAKTSMAGVDSSSRTASNMMGIYDKRIADERSDQTSRANAQWDALGSIGKWFAG